MSSNQPMNWPTAFALAVLFVCVTAIIIAGIL